MSKSLIPCPQSRFDAILLFGCRCRVPLDTCEERCGNGKRDLPLPQPRLSLLSLNVSVSALFNGETKVVPLLSQWASVKPLWSSTMDDGGHDGASQRQGGRASRTILLSRRHQFGYQWCFATLGIADFQPNYLCTTRRRAYVRRFNTLMCQSHGNAMSGLIRCALHQLFEMTTRTHQNVCPRNASTTQ